MRYPQIEITSDEYRTIQGKNGAFHKQECYLHSIGEDGKVKKYPEKASIFITENGFPKPYPVGMYDIDPASITVNRYGDIGISFIKLKPAKTVRPAAVNA